MTSRLAPQIDMSIVRCVFLARVAATRAKKTHRTFDMSICGANREVIDEVGEAYARVVNRRLPEYFTQLQMQNAAVRIVNGPSVGRASSLGSLAAELALRGLLGLALGLARAFLLEYLDDRVRGRRELERTLDLPILAEIPRHEAAIVR